MNAREFGGGVPLGSVKPAMPEITIYPLAEVSVYEDGLGIGDATHHIQIILPANGREMRIPFNQQGLRRLGRDIQAAGGVAQAPQEQEGS